MKLNGKEWVWEQEGKYYYSTNENGYYPAECDQKTFAYKQLCGAGKKVELKTLPGYSHNYTGLFEGTITTTSSTFSTDIYYNTDETSWKLKA